MLSQLTKSIHTVIKNFSIVSFILYANSAHAALVVDAQTMLQNFSESVPQLMRLTVALAYVIGMVFVARGVMGLKHVGEARTAGSPEHGIKGPLILIGVGAALLYLPSSIKAGLTTLWLQPTPYAYQTEISSPFSDLLSTCFLVLQLIGTIAFIRGLILLTQHGHGHQGSFGKAIAHMVAGILCINMYQFVQAIANTLAIGST